MREGFIAFVVLMFCLVVGKLVESVDPEAQTERKLRIQPWLDDLTNDRAATIH